MSEVIIFGAGDYARIASVYLEADSDHKVAGFAVDGAFLDRKAPAGVVEVSLVPVVDQAARGGAAVIERAARAEPHDRLGIELRLAARVIEVDTGTPDLGAIALVTGREVNLSAAGAERDRDRDRGVGARPGRMRGWLDQEAALAPAHRCRR